MNRGHPSCHTLIESLSYKWGINMLSVRLPEPLEQELAAHCAATQLTKSAVVQKALEKHLKAAARLASKAGAIHANPFSALRGSGNRKFTTDQIMRMTRGDDWNKS